uniref:Ribosomal protein S7 n=1 Tax=Cyanophora paradoxa TaxID=2762 RepID=E9P1F0_CYAPA|nr:ribosomal protein S7 [Cyanophora paradoxa]ADW79202.1 ribosomal protein S7 [Cyanophora paradoxa]
MISSKFLVLKIINNLTKNGKKFMAERVMCNLLNLLQKKYNINPIKILWIVLKKIKPSVEMINRRKSGKIYQIPKIIKPKRQLKIAIKWLFNNNYSQKKNTLEYNLFNEINGIINLKSECLKKKEKLHRLAESNRIYLHYRW